MKHIKGIIKQILPPIATSFYRGLKEEKKSTKSKLFSGVYSSFDEIDHGNFWIQEPWIDLSRNKLKNSKDLFQDEFTLNSYFGDYAGLFCLVINLLFESKPCNILDFGGGTGLTYFIIFPYLRNPENVKYHVIDSNPELFQLGKEHAKLSRMKTGIVYHTEKPKKGEIQVDVLFINTSLQYIHDYSSLLDSLLQHSPKYVILTRLLTGNMETFITCENIFGYRVPCIFVNFQELIDIFSENGFGLIHKSPCAEILDGRYEDNIPEHLRINNTLNLVFKCLD